MVSLYLLFLTIDKAPLHDNRKQVVNFTVLLSLIIAVEL